MRTAGSKYKLTAPFDEKNLCDMKKDADCLFELHTM